MPLTKAKSQVIDIQNISDALAQDSGNPGANGILDYIQTQITTANNFAITSINDVETALNVDITTINTVLSNNGITNLTAGSIMFKSDNLSGLTNVPLARSNLGIFNATSTQIGIIQLATYSDISATGSLIKSTAPKHVYDAIQEFATIPLTSVISALDEVTFKVDNKFNEFGSNETS